VERNLIYRECQACGGTGLYYGKCCPACHGKGIQSLGIFETDTPARVTYRDCKNCGGSGIYYGKTCPVCEGKGAILIDFH